VWGCGGVGVWKFAPERGFRVRGLDRPCRSRMVRRTKLMLFLVQPEEEIFDSGGGVQPHFTAVL
jgi:hypothetical protein